MAGASGMVGRAIVDHILKHHESLKVRAVHYSQDRPFDNRNSIEWVQADLRQQEDCVTACKNCNYAILAAATTGGIIQSQNEPWKQVNDNLVMNAHMLEALHKNGIRRVVLIGSSTCYQPFEGKIAESELNWGVDPYETYHGIGWVTRYLEKLAEFWCKKADMQIICVRASNIFGPYAKFDPAVSNFIPAIIRKAHDRLHPFEVWGSPENTRDVIYSEDFASAVVQLLLNTNINHDVFNVGTGIPIRVGDVVDIALKVNEYEDAEILYNTDKGKAVHSRTLNCEKLFTALGWSPQHSIEEAIKKTALWWSENKTCWTR